MNNKHKFDCAILTQWMTEEDDNFARRISEKINDLLDSPNIIGSPYALPIANGNGRKEVMIQWYASDSVETIKPSSLLALTLQLNQIRDAMGCECQKEGYGKCIDDILNLFPEIESLKQFAETVE